MKKADISITTIFVIVITIISILLLLGLFSTKLPTFAKEIYCKTFFYVHSSVFVPRALRADQTYCYYQKRLSPPVFITDSTSMNITVLGYMLACWKEMDYGAYNQNQLCYELVIGDINGTVSLQEDELLFLISENELTDIFFVENIEWDLTNNEIRPGQNLLIEYADRKIKIS